MQHLLTSLARSFREFHVLSKVLSPELRRLYWTLLVLPHIGGIGLTLLFLTIPPGPNALPGAKPVAMTLIGAIWVLGMIMSVTYHRQLRREYLWAVDICDSDTGESLRVLKAVQITSYCPSVKQGRVMLKFTKAKRGRIVQIDDNGCCVHFFVDELGAEMDVPLRDDTFGSVARCLGLDKMHLRSLIELHAPA